MLGLSSLKHKPVAHRQMAPTHHVLALLVPGRRQQKQGLELDTDGLRDLSPYPSSVLSRTIPETHQSAPRGVLNIREGEHTPPDGHCVPCTACGV